MFKLQQIKQSGRSQKRSKHVRVIRSYVRDSFIRIFIRSINTSSLTLSLSPANALFRLTENTMSVFEVVDRIRQRVLTEVLDLDPIVEPLEPRAEWPQWMTRGHASSEAAGGEENQKEDLKIRVLSLNAWGECILHIYMGNDRMVYGVVLLHRQD